MEQHRTLKIMANTDNVVEFLFDSPKEGTNDYGIWHRYALKHNGEEVGLFATDALHAKLMNFTVGDRVNIRKEEVRTKQIWMECHPGRRNACKKRLNFGRY